MSDTGLANEGKDVSVKVLYDGALVGLYETVRYRQRAVITKLVSKPLGTVDRNIDTIPEGHELEVEIDEATPGAQELADVLDAAATARVPGELSLIETTRYRNGSVKSYLYRALKKTAFERGVQRGEKTTIRMTLETGKARAAV